MDKDIVTNKQICYHPLVWWIGRNRTGGAYSGSVLGSIRGPRSDQVGLGAAEWVN